MSWQEIKCYRRSVVVGKRTAPHGCIYLNIRSTVRGALVGSYKTFRRKNLAGENLSLGLGFGVL